MIQGIVKMRTAIRTGPGSWYEEVGTVNVGDFIEASENEAQWLHLTKVNYRPTTITNLWVSSGTDQRMIEWKIVAEPPTPPPDVEPPPPPPTSGPFVTHEIKTYSDGSIDLDGQHYPKI